MLCMSWHVCALINHLLSCRMLLEYGPLVVVLFLGVCLFASLVFWFLMPSKQSEEWVQEMAAEKLRRVGLELEL